MAMLMVMYNSRIIFHMENLPINSFIIGTYVELCLIVFEFMMQIYITLYFHVNIFVL